jgi:hypothetical protein
MKYPVRKRKGLTGAILLRPFQPGIDVSRDNSMSVSIEASEDGLMRQKGLLHRFLPWKEVRLFAVGGKADLQPEWIELSSTKVLLRWPFTIKDYGILGGPRYTFLARDTPESPYWPITRGEYEYQLQRLYGYVCLKTNLPLRDLRL